MHIKLSENNCLKDEQKKQHFYWGGSLTTTICPSEKPLQI